ncbi:MAG: cellulase family glycosylhydrolase [Chloroflexi bacterium]|nr:cellulase family glycosylhydrolase [Chloroflexota bacterium]
MSDGSLPTPTRSSVTGGSRLPGAIALAAALVIIAIAIWGDLPASVSASLASLTGEEDLWEQIKGTGALALLSLQGAIETEPLTPMKHSGLSPYGINTFLEQEAELEKVERSLRMIADAGFAWIRQEFPWEDIEISAKGDYWDHRWDRNAWEKYDRIVELARAHGLEIIARLDNPPAWSRSVGNAAGWTLAPPDDYQDYGDYVYAVVSRYRGQIRYYQIWNEPNIYPEWGDQPVSPESYVKLLQIAYRRAKEADPDCVIVAAGLAQTLETGPRNLSDLEYLQRMYAAGAKGYFDVMGAMVYGLWTGPTDRRTSPERTNFGRVRLLREIMVANADADIPIWATEVGWNAVPADFEGTAVYGRTTERKQAEYAVKAYERAATEWPWLGVMNYWFFRRPSDAERDQSWYYFRMVEPDFTPLPVYGSMLDLMQRPPAVHYGYHQEDHWALHYDGEWNKGESDAAVLGSFRTGEPGAELLFTFEGSGLDLVALDPDSVDGLQVTLDGRLVRGLEPGRAPSNDAPTIRVASRLRTGTHTVHVTVLSGRLPLDGIVVYQESSLVTYAIPAALAALAGAALAIWLRARSRS